jgi:hypothetical protein
MQRRIALALSLAFTTIVAAALVMLASSAGWFSDATKAPKTAQAAASAATTAPDDSAAALLYLAAIRGTPAEPNVVTEYVYVDGDRGAPRRAPAEGNLAPAAAAGAGQPAAPPATPRPAPTDPPAPSATAAPASATPPPLATPAPAAPPPQQSAACPTEFVATVVSVQSAGSGTSVAWSNGAVTLVGAGTPGGSSLAPGVRAHVHAMALSAGCTATEIEAGV